MSVPRLQLAHITKRYPAVVANSDVSLTVQPGEAHAMLGENGAGKSTLMKIIYGSVKPDEGSVLWNGQPVHIRNPQEARALGISMVFQHFSLFDTLTVAENVWLGLEKSLSLSQVTHSIAAKASEYGLDIDPARPVHTLSVGEMQRVEIIRSLLTRPKLLILDEPTSVLTPQAVEKLFIVLRKLAAEGCSILYISHKLHEIRELCTACTVLRGGKVTGDCNPQRESNASLSRLMIGAEPPELEHHDRKPGEVVLRVQDLQLAREDQFGVDLDGISLDVRAGEVVGIAGVSGNGQQELLYALSGEDPRAQPSMIQVLGKNVGRFGPAHRRHLGVHFVPEERLGRGAVPTLGLALNLMLTRTEAIHKSGWIDVKALEQQAAGIIGRFNVKSGGPHAAAQSLSGGNLQKFIVGREIDANPKLLILSQPTWGVDVGAAAQIRSEVLALRDAGCAVLVVSEELEELFEISDRLHVIAKGRLSPSIDRARATVSLIGEWMSGLWGGSPAGAEPHPSAGTEPHSSVGAELHSSVGAELHSSVGAELHSSVGAELHPPVRAELVEASPGTSTSSVRTEAGASKGSVRTEAGTSTSSVRTEAGASKGSVRTQASASTGSVRAEAGTSTDPVRTEAGASAGPARTQAGTSTGSAQTAPRQTGADGEDHA